MCQDQDLLDDDKPFVAEMMELLEAKRQLEEAIEAGEIDGQEAEQRWSEHVQDLERTGIADLMEAANVDAPSIEINGEKYYRVDSACGPKTYRPASGPVEVERTVYRRRGEHNAPLVCPLEMRWGIVGGSWTPSAARMMGHLTQQMPARRAAETAEELGRLPYHHSSFQKLARQLGETYQQQAASIDREVLLDDQLPDQAASLVVSLDRVSLPIDESQPESWQNGREIDRDIHYRMAWCGTISLCDEEGEPTWTRRYGQVPTEGDLEALGERLQRDLRLLCERYEDARVVCLSDGASELDDLLETYCVEPEWSGDPVRLFDPWHLYSYLNDAIQAHAGSETDAREQLRAWQMGLMKIPDFIEFIEAYLTHCWGEQRWIGADDEPVEKALTYIDERKEHMNYAPHREAGRPVGTGHVEATCKSLVQLRMKRSGQYWKRPGGQAIMELRSLALSDAWESGMRALLSTYRTDADIYVRKQVA